MKTNLINSKSKIDFRRLSTWENELKKCIRCGYCFELCPLFKTFNWESNTPRGKLVLLHGLISGRIDLNHQILNILPPNLNPSSKGEVD